VPGGWHGSGVDGGLTIRFFFGWRTRTRAFSTNLESRTRRVSIRERDDGRRAAAETAPSNNDDELGREEDAVDDGKRSR